MLSRTEASRARMRAARMLRKAGIILSANERKNIEIADFGLSDLNQTGLEIVVYENNNRYCAKELVLFPRQTCPEHWHPPVGAKPGKMETFRCRWGEAYLYVPGRKTTRPKARPPKGRERWYRMNHEIVLKPGDQFTIKPGQPHWFQAGPKGAVVSEFSSTSTDAADVFRDPDIQRATKVY